MAEPDLEREPTCRPTKEARQMRWPVALRLMLHRGA